MPFHVISVLSSLNLQVPGEMFDFYVSEGIKEVCFNVEESEGSHVSPTFARRDVEAEYHWFMSEFWRLSAANPGKLSFIREIDHAIQQILRPRDAVTANQLIEPFAVTSMDVTGNISTFSPELLGLKSEKYGDYLLGNINTDRLVDLPGRKNWPTCSVTSARASSCAGRNASISACAVVASRSTNCLKMARSSAARLPTAG